MRYGLKGQAWGWIVLAGCIALIGYFSFLPVFERRVVAQAERENERQSELPLPVPYNGEITVVLSFNPGATAEVRERNPNIEDKCDHLCASLLFSKSADRVNVLRAVHSGDLLLGRTFYLDDTYDCPPADFDEFLAADSKVAAYALDGLCIKSHKLTALPSGIYVDDQRRYGRNRIPKVVYDWVQIDFVDETGTHFVDHQESGKAKVHAFPPIFVSGFYGHGGFVHRLAYGRIPFGPNPDLDAMLSRATGIPMVTDVPDREKFELTAERSRRLQSWLPYASPRIKSELRMTFRDRVDIP